jgi:alpha-tubulin suppressor-like RCC1 family protein
MIEDIEEIVAIAAGGAHSLLLNSRGQVYSFGNNNYGQLGLGDQNHRRVPILLDDSRIGRVTAIEAGTYYSLLLNDQGQVFSFGSGSSGKLGHGDNNDRNVPTLIFPSQGQIMSISAGGGHSFLLDARGRYYGFGSSSMGQLGNGVYERDLRRGLTLIHPDRNVPTWTPVPKLFKVVAISAGYSHTLFLNSQGQAFSCGYGFMGRLGLGDNKDQSQPVLLESPELGTIIDVAAGSAHSLILNSQGQIFSFGHGGFGQLGLGKTENRNVPTLIEDFSI